MSVFDAITVKTAPCIHCKETSEFTVDAGAYQQWKGGTLCQYAFPDMDDERRELLISGIHPACWDAMFGEPVCWDEMFEGENQ